MPAIYIHVGIPKTGTTFLQQCVFPALKGIAYTGGENYSGPPAGGIMGLMHRIVYTNPAFFDLDQAAAVLQGLLPAHDSALLISWERLFGNMFANYFDNIYIAGILNRLFPSARIVMVIRRQDDLLESIYRQTLRGFHYETANSFLNYRRGDFNPPNRNVSHPNVDVRLFDFRPYVANYARLFGPDNLLVLPYELMQSDRQQFLDRLCSFLGVATVIQDSPARVHDSYSLLSCYAALAMNRFLRIPGDGARLLQFIPEQPFARWIGRNGAGPLAGAVGAINRMASLRWVLTNGIDRAFYLKGKMINSKKRGRIMDIHREGNRALDEMLQLGLDRYGYY